MPPNYIKKFKFNGKIPLDKLKLIEAIITCKIQHFPEFRNNPENFHLCMISGAGSYDIFTTLRTIGLNWVPVSEILLKYLVILRFLAILCKYLNMLFYLDLYLRAYTKSDNCTNIRSDC